MAKRFGGFTPQQQQTLLSKMGYTGPAQQDDINKFMMSSPKAASMMGRYTEMAKARVEGGPQMAMHLGGDVPVQQEAGQSLADAATTQQAAVDQSAATQDPQIAAVNTANAAAMEEFNRPRTLAPRPMPQINPGIAGGGGYPAPVQTQPFRGTQGTTDPQSRAYLDAFNQIMQDRVTAFNQGQDQTPVPGQPFVQRPLQQPQMQVRQNPQTGSFEVVNNQGKVVRSNLDNQQQAMQYVMEQRQSSMPTQQTIQATFGGRPLPRPRNLFDPSQQYYNPTEAEQGYLQNIGNYNQSQQQAINAYMQHQNLMASPMAETARIQPLNPAYREELYNIGMLERPEPQTQSNPFIAGTFNPSMFANMNQLQGFADGGMTDPNALTVADPNMFPDSQQPQQQLATQPFVQPAVMPAQQPNTTGGFDMAPPPQPVAAPAPTPQPAPPLPKEVETPDYTDVAKKAMEGVIPNDSGWAAEQTATLIENETIRSNPDDYTLRKDGKYWTLVYPDGTEIKSGYRKQSQAVGRAEAISKGVKAASSAYDQYQTDQQSYEKALGDYKSYYSGQAGEAVKDPETIRNNLNTAQQTLGQQQGILQQYTNQLANMAADDPQRAQLEKLIEEQKVKVTQAQSGVSTAKTALETVGMPSTTELRSTALDKPEELVTKQDVVTVSDEQRQRGMIASGTGQAPSEAAKAEQTIAKLRDDVPLAKEFEAAGMTTAEAAAEVEAVMSKLTAVTGKPSAEALAEAATMDPEQLSQLGLTVDQIERAQKVEAIPALEMTEEMKVSSAVDFERAKAETNFTAATGVPSTEATVQGQLTSLMEQFEDGETPAWAAGAMRAATQRMAARGLAASSMAGQAIVQAAMESALPIAQQDAQTRASFEAQNLSNRQQAAMFAAEQRSKFLGMEFDQEFQSRVQNAAKVADIAQINFTAEQQVALENARMAQTVDLANMDAKNAKILADAAAMSQLELANLNNRQQANVQRAKAFLDFDMSSMSNQQQVAMFKAQSLAAVYTSDTAAENASRQFNASSEDQVNMFMSNLQTSIQKFNNEQANAMEMFNAGEANAISKFNAEQQNIRDQFNASQALAVEQANAQWEQAITTMDNAAQNQANRDAAIAANGLTETTYNNMLQQERDALDYVWRSADNALSRENALLQVEMQTNAQVSSTKGEAAGAIASVAADYLLKKFLPI